MLNALLKKFNHLRAGKYFQRPLFHTQKEYAFVGVGIHSITALYPVLRHFNVRLKYICTRTSDWQTELAPLFPGCHVTHDLNALIDDPSVAGVFICASPGSHFEILSRMLRAGKPIFTEKPPCQTLAQLHELQSINAASICKIGLQRRYWPGNKSIVKKCLGASTYLYQFQTGPLVQGDPFTELFIHPLDYIRFLFGESHLQSSSKHRGDKGLTVQLHLSHAGGRSGLVQLSTNYAWNPPLETLTVNSANEWLDIRYPLSVTGRQIPARLMNLPTERLVGSPNTVKEYYSGAPTLIPALETNSFFTQGFLTELEDFITRVENPGVAGEANDLASLAGIYEIFDTLRS